MSTNAFNSFLGKLGQQMGLLSSRKPLNAIYIGNGGETLINSHFDFTNHVEDVLRQPTIGDISDLDTIIIVGNLNLNQVNKLKKIYDELGGTKKYVIQVRGGLSDDEMSRAYFICNNLEEHISIDLKYNRYPLDMDELFTQIKELKDGVHES
jgi:hypothetical protein